MERDGRWVARAFANRMPALVVEEVLEDRGRGPFQAVSGVGAHEVLVEAPEHAPLHRLPVERTADALALAVDRLRDLRRDQRLSPPVVPEPRGRRGRARRTRTRRSWGCRSSPAGWRRWSSGPTSTSSAPAVGCSATSSTPSTPTDTDGFRDGPITALCPFAPRHPFEVWLVPEDLGQGFADATDDERSALARASHRIASALAIGLGEIPTTTIALGAPERPVPAHVGWHVRIAPRLTIGAGLEEATGVAVHSVFPEEAARSSRNSVGGG